jgi:N-acetylneuraminic acid mutarotase
MKHSARPGFLFLITILLLLQGCGWFVVGGVGATVYYLQSEDAESAPVVVITAPARMIENPAQITFTLHDAEANPCEITIEYSVNNGDFHPAVQGTGGDGASGLASSSEGSPHTFSWDFSSGPDLTLPETNNVTVRITARDASGLEGSTTSPGHSLGNAQPVISDISVPTENVTGTATISYMITDAHSDPSTIQVQFMPASGSWAVDGLPATPDATPPSYALQNITTQPSGSVHLYPWDSDNANDMLGEDGQVMIRIRASDDGENTWSDWVESSAFDVRNDGAPCVEIGSISSIDQNGIVYIPYTCTDAENDDVTIFAEFKHFGGLHWKRATAGPGTTPTYFPSSASGSPGFFAWDTARDGVHAQDVAFRLAVSQKTRLGLFDTKDFTIGNDCSNPWSLRKSMPTARRQLACATVGGKIYAIGGYGGYPLDTVEEYNPIQNTWTAKTSMPTARSNLACAVVEGKIYAIGGYGRDTVEEYNPIQNTWTTKTPMPTARSSLACAVVGGKIYAIGGHDGSNYMATVEEYDPAQNTWATKTDMPTARNSLACATVAGKIYAIGGHDGSNYLATVEEYDPAQNTWATKTDMHSARHTPACATVAGKIYAIGGFDGSNLLATMEEYDPALNTWTTKTPMPTARIDFACATVAGKIYAIGGHGGVLGCLATVEEYDPVQNTWTTKTDMPTARSKLACAAVDGIIYTIGGWSGTKCLSTLDVYDPVQNTWATKTSMSAARQEIGCAVVGGKIYAIGGGLSFLANVEKYDPAQDTWTMKTPMPTARTHLACTTVNGKIYAIGGYNGSYLATVEEYSLIQNLPLFRSINSTTSPSSESKLVTVSGAAYRVGGRNSTSNALDSCSESQFVKDIEDSTPFEIRSTWSAMAVMNTARRAPGAAEYNGSIYVAGGFDHAGTPLSDMEQYDPSANTWTSLAGSMTTARGGLGVVRIGDKLYAFGGDTGSGIKTAVMEIHDLSSGSWTAGGSMTTARSHFGYGLEPDTGCIFVFGGEGDAAAYLDTVEKYDPAADSWTTMSATLPTALKGPLCLFEGYHLKLFGGEKPSGAVTRAVLVYSHWADSWTAAPVTLPYPARDMFGSSEPTTWNQRGVSQTDRFCLLGGGFDGTNHKDGFFRFYTR